MRGLYDERLFLPPGVGRFADDVRREATARALAYRQPEEPRVPSALHQPVRDARAERLLERENRILEQYEPSEGVGADAPAPGDHAGQAVRADPARRSPLAARRTRGAALEHLADRVSRELAGELVGAFSRAARLVRS